MKSISLLTRFEQILLLVSLVSPLAVILMAGLDAVKPDGLASQ